MRILIIGAGIFGTSAATILADKNNKIDLVEAENDILQLASRVNHNRIHLGYHYLRSIQTAEQSIEGLLSFLFNYGKAVIHQLPNYYAIAKQGSKTTPAEFVSFCESVGIGYDDEYPDNKFLNREAIRECFKVPEPVWDYDRLKKIIVQNLKKSKVNLVLNTECINLKQLPDQTFEATFNNSIKQYDVVINTTYSNINKINKYLGVEPKKLLFENVLIPVFKYPSAALGLTIMDGPFCSVMPRGKVKNEFLLYHVKESIIQSQIAGDRPLFDYGADAASDKKVEDIIYRESSFFMPFLNKAEHVGYNKTTRVVYENSDDARITELHTYPGVKNYFSILSGKVTTCMQVALEIKHILQGRQKTKKSENMKLHLGCGRNIKEGYINIDKYVDFPGVEKLDIFNLPYEDNSADEILSEHLAEHIGFKDEEKFWRECARVLKPGGKLVTETPDMEWLCKQFLEAEDSFKEFYKVGAKDHYFGNGRSVEQRWGMITTHFFGNQNGEGQFHYNGYTKQKMIRIAEMIGMGNCKVEKIFNKGAQALVATMVK